MVAPTIPAWWRFLQDPLSQDGCESKVLDVVLVLVLVLVVVVVVLVVVVVVVAVVVVVSGHYPGHGLCCVVPH
jgi:hypothetical protein